MYVCVCPREDRFKSNYNYLMSANSVYHIHVNAVNKLVVHNRLEID